MKRLLCLFICLLLAGPAMAETWIITSLDWQPYSGADMTNEGNSIQKLRTALAQDDIELLVEFYPWKRAQTNAKSSRYIGYFPAWPEEVAEGFVASKPVDWSSLGVMMRSDENVQWQTVDDLFKNYSVGIIKTYVYPQSVQDAMHKYPDNVHLAPDEMSLLKKLSIKRDDVALTDPAVMTYLAQKNGTDNVTAHAKIIEKKPLVIAFRDDPANRKRLERLNKLLKE